MSLYDRITEARGAGYSDDEILDTLRKKYPVYGAGIDTALSEQYKPTEIIDHLAKKAAPIKDEARAPGKSYDAFTGTFEPGKDEDYDVAGAGKALVAGVKRLPQELAATVIQTAKGQSGATVTDKGPLDRFLEENAKDREAFIKEFGSDKQVLPGVPISVKDVAELPSNLAFSGTSAVAGLAAGGATLAATKSPGLAWTAGGAASGAMAYRATSNQIMQQYLEAMNETAQEQFGRDITPEEEAKLKSKFSNLATAYGLWEAVPEAIGNVTELNIILKPLSKMVGENVAKKIISKVWKTYGTELGTETITQMGQQRVESEMGLTPEAPRQFTSPTDWATSAKEVAPAVFLLTTLMGGAVGGSAAVYRKYKSKTLSDTVQNLSGNLDQMQDEEVDTLLENAKEIKKKRSFDKKLDDSITKIEAEAEKRKTATPVIEGEAEEVTAEVTPYPAMPQDAFDQMKAYLIDGKDNKGNPFTLDHVKVFRERYTSDPKANPESIRMLDQFIEDAEAGEVLKPTEDTTQLMHTLRSEAMQGLPIDQVIEKGNEIKGRHPKLADDINKMIIEFQGKKLEQPVYHGTTAEHAEKIKAEGIIPGTQEVVYAGTGETRGNPLGFSVSKNRDVSAGYGKKVLSFRIKGEAKIATADDVPASIFRDVDGEMLFNQIDAVKWAKENGYDGIDLDSLEKRTSDPGKSEEIQIFNPAVLEEIAPVETPTPEAAVTPPPAEIAPQEPAGEAVAPKPKGFDPDNDRQRNIFVSEILKSEAPEVKALMKQAEEAWPGEDPLPVVESQIDYDLQKTPEKWLGTAAGKEILARKGWGEKAKETPPASSPAPETEKAPEKKEPVKDEIDLEAGRKKYADTERLLKEKGYKVSTRKLKSEKDEQELLGKGYKPYLLDKEGNLKTDILGIWAKEPEKKEERPKKSKVNQAVSDWIKFKESQSDHGNSQTIHSIGNHTIRPMIRRMFKEGWVKYTDLGKKDTWRKSLDEAGLVDKAWDEEGNTYYGLKGTPLREGLMDEAEANRREEAEKQKEEPKGGTPYFTVKKAQAIIATDFKSLSDEKLQKTIVTLRDFNRFVGDTQTYRKQLDEGGYFKDVVDPNASGVVPKDMWLLNNLRTALDEALAEKKERAGKPQQKKKTSLEQTFDEQESRLHKVTGSFLADNLDPELPQRTDEGVGTFGNKIVFRLKDGGYYYFGEIEKGSGGRVTQNLIKINNKESIELYNEVTGPGTDGRTRPTGEKRIIDPSLAPEEKAAETEGEAEEETIEDRGTFPELFEVTPTKTIEGKDTGKTTPKQQKAFLIDAIDTLIKDAPKGEAVDMKGGKYGSPEGIEAQYTRQSELRQKYGIVRIEVPDDGTFNIINTKESLEAFKKAAQKFPLTTGVKEDKVVPLPSVTARGKRIAEEGVQYYNEFSPRKQGLAFRPDDGTNNNYYSPEGYFTNGYYAVKTSKPKGVNPDSAPSMKSTLDGAKQNIQPARLVGEFYLGGDPERSNPLVHVIGEDGTEQVVNATFIDSILTEHPDAKAFSKKEQNAKRKGLYPIFFKVKNEIVGVTMPVQFDSHTNPNEIFAERIKEITGGEAPKKEAAKKTEPKPKTPKPKKEKAPTRGEVAKEFYQPGNIIWNGYFKFFDKVLEVKGEIGKEGWQVKVQKVDKDGKPLEDPRWHSTLPDKTDRIEKKAEPVKHEDVLEEAADGKKSAKKKVDIPEGWTAEVGKTRTKEGHTAEAEVDWQGKRLVFSEQKHMDNPDIWNHEVAHVVIETMPDNAKLFNEYADLKEAEWKKEGYEKDWIVKNQFHREQIAMDYGNYLTDPKSISDGLQKLFAKYFAEKKAEAAKQPWEMQKKDFIKDSELSVINNEKEGPKPNKYKEGDLAIDDYGDNPYVYQLQYLDPQKIEFGLEGETRERVINMPSTQRYIEWSKQGIEPSPITVVLQGDKKTPYSTNRRRVIAAQEAGTKKIPAFVEIGRHKDMIEQALSEGKPVPKEVLAEYPDLKPRQPWEMTYVEFYENKDVKITSALTKSAAGNPAYKYTAKYGDAEVSFVQKNQDINRATGILHKKFIEKALSENKPVPQAVLDEYPELKKGKSPSTWFELGKAVAHEYGRQERTGKTTIIKPNISILRAVAETIGIKLGDAQKALSVYNSPAPVEEAKRFKDSPVPAMAPEPAGEGKGKTEDAGVELTYNKRNRIRGGIKWSDIEGKNTALKVKETTKQNVYPRPDYEAMIKGGMDPMVAHFVKQVYDSISAKPNVAQPTDADLQRYIEGVNRVMAGAIKWASNNEAIGQWAKSQLGTAKAYTGTPVNISDMAKSVTGLLDTVYFDGWKNNKEELRIIGGNKVLRALQPGFDEGKRAIKAVKDGWPAQQEAWQKRGWRVGETSKILTIEPGRDYTKPGNPEAFRVVIDHRRFVNEAFATKEEAETFVKGHKPWLLFQQGGAIKDQFATEAEAQEGARELVKREKKTDQVSEKGTSVEMAERTGPARRMEGEDISSDRLMQTFGFKGVNFGNWMKGDTNQKERQLHLNHAFDSFMDLAEILDVPPKALSLNGMLGLAIGAQGTGKHAAHFVPGVNEINLTRTGGAGAVAHEWGHGLDHYFATQAGLAGNREPFLTEHADSRKPLAGLRPEIAAHFKAIVQAMRKRNITEEEQEQRTRDSKERARKNTESWIKAIRSDFDRQGKVDLEAFDKLARRIMHLDLGEGKVSAGGKTYLSPVVAEMRDLYKTASGRVYDIGQIQSLQANIDLFAHLNSERHQQREHVPQQTNTKYLNEALHLDKDKSGKKYWSTNLEMFARAFDAYVTDTLKAKAAKNTYLSGIESAPPRGTERTALNEAFKSLIDEIQTRETPQGVEMYEVSAWHGSPHTFGKFSAEKIGTGEGAQAYGYGLYFSGKREVAEWYKKKLADNAPTNFTALTAEENLMIPEWLKEGIVKSQDSLRHAMDGRRDFEDRLDQAKSMVRTSLQPHLYEARVSNHVDTLRAINKLIDAKDFGFDKKPGRLYRVELAPNEDEFLLWDKPLSGQSEKVKAALYLSITSRPGFKVEKVEDGGKRKYRITSSGGYLGRSFSRNPSDILEAVIDPVLHGEQIYKTYGEPKAASEYLHALGIRGIKYLNQSSRSQGEGDYNYVIFSDDDVAIKEMFNVRDQHRRGALRPAKLEDVRKFFPGQEVGLDANKNIYVKTRGGKYVTLYKVDRIDADNAVLQAGYGKPNLAPGAVIPGAMGVTHKGDLYIKLHRTFGDTWTLAHESMHFMETAGIINSLDVAALRGHIKRLSREGKWSPANKSDIGGPEDRANFIADRLAVKEQRGPIGRIILRIRAFIDGILETFGVRSPESILRGIESGKIFERTGREGKGGEQYALGNDKIYRGRQKGQVEKNATWWTESKDMAQSFSEHKRGGKPGAAKATAEIIEAALPEGRIADIGEDVTSRLPLSEIAKKLGIPEAAIRGTMAKSSDPVEQILSAENGPVRLHTVLESAPVQDLLRNEGIAAVKAREKVSTKGESTSTYLILKRDTTGDQYFSVLTPDLPDFMQQYLTQKAEEVQKEYGPFAFDEKSTKNEGWFQLHPADQFKDFRKAQEWKGIPKTEGVTYVIGTREGLREPQAVRFDKEKFTEDQAKAWWEKHKKYLSTKDLWRPKAKEIPAFDAGPKKLNSWLDDETDMNVQRLMKREADLAKRGAQRLMPANLPHNTWLENILKSPEWMEHPVISRIVRLMMRTRSELFHENFHHMTDNKVIEATKDLKGKGLSWAKVHLQGKVSKEYELFGRLMDYGDTYYKRNRKDPLDKQKKDFEKWMRATAEKQGFKKESVDEIIKVWKLHRDTYDRGLDMMTAQMRTMLQDIEERAKETGEEPSALKQTLQYHLAAMDEWKGFYAPRVRTKGSWWVWAHKGPIEKREYVMDFRGSGMAADRLAAKLKEQGWTVSRVEEAKRLPEDIYQQTKTIAVARAIEQAMADMKQGVKGQAHDDLIAKFHEELLENVSDEIKARGFRSSMIHRSTDKIVKGYKEDPLERLVIYTNNTSAGLAKATTAKMAVNELFGELDEETGEHIGGIDPVKEPRAYTTAQSYIEEQLRNMDKSDMVIGLAKSIATFKYLGFNIRSAFVNTTALATTAPPAIQQYALDGKVGFHKVMNALAVASKDYGTVMAGRKLENADEQDFMDEIKRLGYDDPQYTRDALGSIMKFQHRAWGMAVDASMYVFGKTEQWNRGTTMLAAYRLARKEGAKHDEAMEKAKTASDKAHGVYGKATLPMWAMGRNPAAKIGQMMYVYGKFSHNYLQMLYDLGFKKKNLKGLAFATLAPIVVGGMAAFPFREQIFGLFGFILKALLGEDRDPEKWVWDEIRKHFGSTAEIVGRHGLTGALGLDISSSLSIGVGVPKGMGDLAGPAGGVYEDVMEGFRYARQGQAWRSAEKFAPRALENPLKALRESREGATTRHGYRVWDEKGKPFIPSEGEAAARAFGFRGTRQAVISERTNEAKREIRGFGERKAAIYEQYRAYLAGKKDPAVHREITRKVREFNDGLKKADIPKEEVPRITFESMRRQAERMKRPTKQQRAMLE